MAVITDMSAKEPSPQMSIPKYLVLPLAALLLAGIPARAQSDRASVRGLILDPSGAAIPRVRVQISDDGTGLVRLATSGGEGEFAFPTLAPGSYLVKVELTGYQTSISETELMVNQRLWLEINLELGDVSEEIRVTAPLVPIDQQSAALRTVIDSQQIARLPLDGRNFLELSLLAPGTASASQGSASSQRGDFAFTVNGGREDAQSFLLDGVYNIDPKLNTPAVRPPVDAIREFEVVTGTYDASFGRNAAGQVNVVTRSGTNTIHGTAYGFFRNESLGASNFFAPANEDRPEFSKGQYGFSIGGPITRERTFFFFDYQRSRLREGVTRITNVPTRAERNGDFSESLSPAPKNFLTGQAFSGNTIPSFFINPTGQAIANLYPLPNRATPSANYISSPTQSEDIDHFDVRVNHNFENGTTFSTRYSFSDSRRFEPFPLSSQVRVPGYGTDIPRRGQNLAVSVAHAWNPSLISELRFGYTRVGIGVIQENQSSDINQAVGLPNLSANPRDIGLSQITITGFSPLGDEFTSPQTSAADTFQILDTITWATGRHLVKTGFDFRYIRQGAYRDVQSRGFLNFSDRYMTGNALADLLMGFPLVTGGATLDNPQRLRSTSWSGFLQDSYRVLPNLTITAGLRYEYVGPAVDADDRANLYDKTTGSLVPVGTGNMPRGGYESDYNNFGPRIGIAWAPVASNGTVIRGGYGIYYNQGALATGEGLYFSPPFFNLNLFYPLGAGLPMPTLNDPYPKNFPLPSPPSATGYQRNLRTPRIEHWSVSVQRQLGATRVLEVAYVGSRGNNLIAARDINQPSPSVQFPNIRPNPLFSDVTFIESRGHSDYDALQIKFQQRFERGLSILSSYTFGKSMDDASGFFASTGDPNLPQDSRNPKLEYSRSSFDVRHRLSTSFSWEIPFGSGRTWLDGNSIAVAILGNWDLHGIMSLAGGQPYTVALLPEIDNSNTGRSNLGFGSNDRPNLVGSAVLPNPTPTRWFNIDAFEIPAFGEFGNVGRNSMEGPGYSNFNLGVHKNIALTETTTIQIRAEAFNLFNRNNFDLPDAFLNSPTFGQVVSAGDPLRCQFGFKLIF